MSPPSQASAAEGATLAVGGAEQALLLCRVGSLICALPLPYVSETMRPLPCEPVLGMPPFVDGLAVIRGAPVPVVDLARLLGSDSHAPRTRFVVVKVSERRVALSVEHVIGVRARGALVTSGLPPLLGRAGVEFVASVASLDAHLLVVLESGLILPESVWTTLDRGAGAA
jgi:purine-binding chemotaxis protein CheW